MKKRFKLSFPEAMRKIAEREGAYFDNELGAWFIDDDVPNSLIAFTEKELRRRDYASEVTPQCTICGCRMELTQNRKTKEPFWRCATYRCPGTKPYDALTIKTSSQMGGNVQRSEPESFENKHRAEILIRRAVELFRSEAPAIKWLKMEKIALNGQTPLEAIKTEKGCEIVERLLDERFE
ncbi:uncharacterized protein DUF2384 [Paucimonas lemoignei]|uniref:Uncharacterized protein DUF2384 n=1 Tax=Paucimonas lemoignei TaxID=29443 RepID=A0A4R3HW90_PAULE|nr:MbcA/ParS/Xre antitoxin family protein [Paucimonas lemoignei]TCS35639.1 uncharacterized protein DUF2384 [Paucimonas lemoignei]